MTFFLTHRSAPLAHADGIDLSWLERLAQWADQHGERHRHRHLGSYIV